MNIEEYGFRFQDLPDHTAGIPARVLTVHRDRFEIACDRGIGSARLKTGVYRPGGEAVPTTGDFVMLDWRENGESRILNTLPRRTYFSRLDPSSSGNGEQAVAANFDYVFIVQSLDRNFNPRGLERYLTLAWQSGAAPVVVLTKADCVENATERIRAAERLAVGVTVFAISAKTGEGLDKPAEYLKPGKTIVLLGASGAGKSTLINALAGEVRMKTGGVREKDGRGRHTTSRRQLFLLPGGVMMIDTPGMREIGMWNAGDGLGQSFSDVEQFLGNCKFHDCRHRGEPGCAVTIAIRNGTLTQERWESYQKLYAEARYAEDKTGYMRKKRQRFKEIAKYQKAVKGLDYRHMPCTEVFACEVCKALVVPDEAGSLHRNHCPHCLSSVHLDNRPGDRASLCRGRMDPIAVWARKNGEWAIVHRCQVCGALSSNRIAADDDGARLMSIAMKPLTAPLQQLKVPEGVCGALHAEMVSCRVCGTLVVSDETGGQRDHCPRCLSGIHHGNRPGGRGACCRGVMEPIAIWIQKNGGWQIIQRCRSCGSLRSSPVAAEDNTILLLSIAMRPLGAPPFPLWELGQYR